MHKTKLTTADTAADKGLVCGQHAASKEESMSELTKNPELNHQENKARSIGDSNIWLLLGLGVGAGVGAFLGLLAYTQHWL